MSTPTPDQVRVATGALRSEADRWEQQGGALTDAAGRARALAMTELEAGIFGIFVTAYQEAHAQVTARCDEGGRSMHTVGSTLRDVADTYDREESRTEHRIRNLY